MNATEKKNLGRGACGWETFKVMTCTLREHVVTEDGDFLPAGTPVQVVGWGDGNDYGKVFVRSLAYMWCDTFSMVDVEEGRCGGCVGSGLWIAVHPGNLMFSEMRTETRAN